MNKNGMSPAWRPVAPSWAPPMWSGRSPTLTPFNADFQNFITRYAWGEIWDRPGLPRQTRSLITLAMLVALNRGDELRLHIQAALRNGVTAEEIQEVFLHCAIYCGVPAANAAFHLAEDVLATDTPE